MNWLWISGWGLPPAHVKTVAQRHFSEISNQCLPPVQNLSEQVAKENYTCLLGYSLGAFLILLQTDVFPRMCPRILFAPFLDFKKESETGSRVATSQLKILLRTLKSDPLRAINDFYKRAGLDIQEQQTLPYALEDLTWGIETLLSESVTPEAFEGMRGFIGRHDPLLDAATIQTQLPELTLVPQADHRLETLISAMKPKPEVKTAS